MSDDRLENLFRNTHAVDDAMSDDFLVNYIIVVESIILFFVESGVHCGFPHKRTEMEWRSSFASNSEFERMTFGRRERFRWVTTDHSLTFDRRKLEFSILSLDAVNRPVVKRSRKSPQLTV